jgi:hypothetical protein
MQKMQHDPLQGQTKIVVKSSDHEEIVDATKLQNSMVCLMYATTKTVDWDNGTIKSISLATFTQEYQNLLELFVSVQVTQLASLFRTIFSNELDEDNNDNGPLNRLMSLYVFPPKFTKGHLNATFHSNNLEVATINKSTSINPFHYALQLDQISVAAVKKEVIEEQNKKTFAIVERNRKKILALIEGIGKNQLHG